MGLLEATSLNLAVTELKMNQYIAFLRAINVGGHVVKMDQLRLIFQAAGFANVETFIASGNVLFEFGSRNAAALEKKIESQLKQRLGYEVATFIRTPAALASSLKFRPFADADLNGDGTLYVAFTKAAPIASMRNRIVGLSGTADELLVQGREIYWLCRKSFRESGISGALVEKTLGMPVTIRNINTIRRIVAKLGPVSKWSGL